MTPSERLARLRRLAAETSTATVEEIVTAIGSGTSVRAGECRTCESESKSRIILSLNAGGSQVLAAVAGVRSEVCPGCFLRKVVAVRPEALWQLNVEGG